MGAKSLNENTISLKFYHEKLVDDFERRCDSSEERNGDRNVFELLSDGDSHVLSKEIIEWILESSGGFNKTLVRLYKEETDKGNYEIHFDYLFVSLSRIIPIIDRFVGQLCDLNIGREILCSAENVKPMRRALAWLYVYSTRSKERDYQDIQRTQRLVRNKISEECDFNNYELQALMKEVARVFDEAHPDDKEKWIGIYKKQTEALLNEMFECYGTLHAYFDIMRSADRELFEAELSKNKGSDKIQTKSQIRSDYQRILLLAKNVLVNLLHHFVSYAKIGDINFPHGQFSDSDLISVDLSGSNFISSDFSCSDLTDAILRNSDISVSNLTKCNAQNVDFSGCKLNSSSLLGSDFTNAILSGAQMSAVAFRNVNLDYDINFYKQCSDIGEVRKYITARAKYYENRKGGDCRARFRTFFNDFSIDQQDLEAGRFTEAWKLTSCDRKNAAIAFKTAMDGACELMERELSEAFDAYRYRAVPYSLFTDEAILKCNAVCFRSATMEKAFMPEADLSYVDFESAMVADADMSGGKFWYTNFLNASLSGSNASGTEFYGVALSGADCSKTNFIDAMLLNCDLVGCNLNGALMINAAVINEKFISSESGARKPYINWIYNENSPIYDAIDDRVFEENNSMCDANLDGVMASNALFSGLNMDRSSWQGATSKKAIFFNCVARWAFFNDIDFSYAILLGVSFHQTALSNALMPKSRLYACDMSGVKLNRANMTGSKLERVIFMNADLSGTNFSRSVIVNCHFNDVNFAGTNFSGTVFENVIFENVDFSDCIGLANAMFHNCAFGSNCSRLEYQLDSRRKANKNFMSIMQSHVRMKFFRESERFSSDGVTLDRYSSLSHYLKQK